MTLGAERVLEDEEELLLTDGAELVLLGVDLSEVDGNDLTFEGLV